MKRRLRLLVLSVLASTVIGGKLARGQGFWAGPTQPAVPPAFDPAAAVSVLTNTEAGGNGPAASLTGLATPIEVDPLFGTATASIPVELPPNRKGMTPDLTIRYSSNGGNGIFGLG